MKGFFITLEGIEGSGKTTLAKRLKKHFEDKGYKVLLTHEPGGPPSAQSIRKLLLHERVEISPWTELFLFMASRRENTEKLIIPALREGYIVISDRYADSSVAYQGYGRGLPIDVIEQLNEIAMMGIKPDITLLLDISVEESFRRMNKSDRIEKEDFEFFRRVRNGYLELARKYPERFIVIESENFNNFHIALKFIEERMKGVDHEN